jgi:outer membrane receptor protein involved in Fe transport
MLYTFENGGMVESITAYVDYSRRSIYENAGAPILTNLQQRGEVFDMWSQDLRYISPRGGMFEWEAGVYWQQEDLDLGNPTDPEYVTETIRGTLRDPIRTFENWQDSEWLSAFATVTFNFLDDRASIDVGGRYTDLKKDSYASGYGAHWIFDIDPDGPGDPTPGNGIIQSTNFDPDDGAVRNVTAQIVDCATGFYACGSYGAGYWTHRWNTTRHIPDAWSGQSPAAAGPLFRGSGQGGTGPIPGFVSGPFLREFDDSNLDHQVTLRYRPFENHSFYGKWATAFKGGGADIATGTLDGGPAFHIESEYAETFELGAKGSLLEGLVNYNLTLFTITVDDLQIATSIPSDLGGGSFSTNAGKQRTRGIELDGRWAATERLTVGLSGALMDGVMVEYEGAGCTQLEFENAATGPCYTAEESEDLFGTDEFEGLIDRSGEEAPRTPDWKFVVDLDYWLPVFDNYKLALGTKTTFTDGYLYNVEDFDRTLSYGKRIITNLNAGYGDTGDTWKIQFYVRNLFNAGLEYFPEYEVETGWLVSRDLSVRNWRTYGVQFQYNYN